MEDMFDSEKGYGDGWGEDHVNHSEREDFAE